MPLFTVVSLLIAISGATFGALAAIRAYQGDNARSFLISAKSDVDKVIKYGNQELIDQTKKNDASLKRWHCLWQWGNGVPVLLFVVTAFVLALSVSINWISKPAESQSVLSDWWVTVCMLCLIVLVIIYVICMGCVLYFYNRMKHFRKSLASNSAIADSGDTNEWLQQKGNANGET